MFRLELSVMGCRNKALIQNETNSNKNDEKTLYHILGNLVHVSHFTSIFIRNFNEKIGKPDY